MGLRVCGDKNFEKNVYQVNVKSTFLLKEY